MRKLWIIAILGGILLYGVATSVGSSMALADIGARPIIALVRDGGAAKVPIQVPGRPVRAGEAGMLGGTGIAFGYRFGYALPGGGRVDCAIRFRRLTCSGGWQADRGTP